MVIFCVSDWQAMLEQNLENLGKEEAYYYWSRDTMFRYLLIMEALQENTKERQEILTMIGEILVQMHDT